TIVRPLAVGRTPWSAAGAPAGLSGAPIRAGKGDPRGPGGPPTFSPQPKPRRTTPLALDLYQALFPRLHQRKHLVRFKLLGRDGLQRKVDVVARVRIALQLPPEPVETPDLLRQPQVL